jgi:four helix bundle protein
VGIERVKAKTFQDLIVWRKAHNYVIEVYHYTSGFPKSEIYALAQQMRRAAVSIPANIAEGFRRKGRLDKFKFMNCAQGSLEESRYYLILSMDLNYGNTAALMASLEEVSRLLHSYSLPILTSDCRSQESGVRMASNGPGLNNLRLLVKNRGRGRYRYRFRFFNFDPDEYSIALPFVQEPQAGRGESPIACLFAPHSDF